MWSRKLDRLILLVLVGCFFSVVTLFFSSTKTPSDKSDVYFEGEDVEMPINTHSSLMPPVIVRTVDTLAQLQELRLNPSRYVFKWENWVDVSDYYSQFSKYLSEETLQDSEKAIDYVKNKMPPPSRIVVLTTPQEYSPDMRTPTQHEVYELPQNLDNGCIHRYGASKCEKLSPVSDSKTYNEILNPKINREMFEWDLSRIIESARVSHSGTDAVFRLKAGDDFARWSVEHFSGTEHTITKYDKRFFRMQQDKADATITLKLLMRAWSVFASTYNIDYWIAQGSIIGYLWNGYPFPWDTDIDVHMPIHTMYQLSMFNGSLFVHDQGGNMRTYFLDVNPAYVNRNSDGKYNAVDAKFIDTSTGASIDIASVSLSHNGWEVCSKSPENFRLSHVETLRIARFAGSLVYVPRFLEQYIKEHYPSAYSHHYGNWDYDFLRKAWIDSTSKCQYYLPLFRETPCAKESSDVCFVEDGITCTKNDENAALQSYAQMHEQELELWDTTPDLQGLAETDPALMHSILTFLNKDYSNLFEDLKG